MLGGTGHMRSGHGTDGRYMGDRGALCEPHGPMVPMASWSHIWKSSSTCSLGASMPRAGMALWNSALGNASDGGECDSGSKSVSQQDSQAVGKSTI